MLFVICVLAMLQAYVITWIIPEYKILEEAVAANSNASQGFVFLTILAVVLVFIAGSVLFLNRKNGKISTNGDAL